MLFKGFNLYCVLSHVVLVRLREILQAFLVVSIQYGKEFLNIKHISLSVSGCNECSNKHQESKIEGLMNHCILADYRQNLTECSTIPNIASPSLSAYESLWTEISYRAVFVYSQPSIYHHKLR
jgi:hypothetical protein